MKQIVQSLRTGETRLEDVPAPCAAHGQVLVHTTASLVSAGTERMLVEFGKAGLIDKARQQPEKVRQVIEKARSDGLLATLDAVRSKLDQPLALGYCNVGRVAATGAGVRAFAVGDRVVSNGKHAEVVAAPMNLCARVPDDIDDESAAFTVLAAIGLQGLRLANPTLGECVVVTGLGLIGLLTVQLLRAQGCRVLGVDMDADRLALARSFGADVVNAAAGPDVLAAAEAFSRGAGVDAVIITASTKSNDPVSQAARMCRKRGRIVLVGVAGLDLNRGDFYEKELTFQVSCSYGPGRYDPAYEDGGHDYPIGFVRWTEQRNFVAVLDMMSAGRIDVAPLISHRFAIEEAEKAFALLTSSEPSLGILLRYRPEHEPARLATRSVAVARAQSGARSDAPRIAFLGAGNYAGRVLIPTFKQCGADLRLIVSGAGVSAVHHARKQGAAAAATDEDAAFGDPEVDAVVIATRHGSHASQVLGALQAGKHVYCEKPLCLTLDELAAIEAEARERANQVLMVGFNRRFSPHVVRMKSLLDEVKDPKTFIVTINAGAVPDDHWTQDEQIGGGRLVGEACHFIDLVRHLANAPFVSHTALPLGGVQGSRIRDDKVIMTLAFADGSTAAIHYLAHGHKGFPKERVEVFCAGRVLQLDNFRKLQGWGWGGFSRLNLWRQDKGVKACVNAFIDAVRSGDASPIPLDETIETARASILLADDAR